MPRLFTPNTPVVRKGTIQLWSGTLATIPRGWVLCEGLIENGNNLVSRHTFDDTLNDSKGTNHGTVSGTTTYSPDRVVGTKSFSFNGSTKITLDGGVEGDFDNEHTDDFAISLWVNGTSISGNEFLAGKRDGLTSSDIGYSLEFEGNGFFEFTLCDGTTEFIVTSPNIDYRDGFWHNVVATYKGNSDSSGMELWVDAKPAKFGGSSAISSTILNDLFPTLGSDNQSGNQYTGLMDDVRFYNTYLNVHDIRRIYANPPNLLSRFVRCVPNNITESGTLGGSDTHTLTTAQMPVHTHTFNESNHTHTSAVEIGNQNNGPGANDGSSLGGTGTSFNTATSFSSTGVTINNTGSGSSHENRPAYYQMAYIMKVSDN